MWLSKKFSSTTPQPTHVTGHDNIQPQAVAKNKFRLNDLLLVLNKVSVFYIFIDHGNWYEQRAGLFVMAQLFNVFIIITAAMK